MKKANRLIYGALAAFAAALLLLRFSAEAPAPAPEKPEYREAVILYTNDVHCAIDGYSALAAYRRQMVDSGCDTAVVDAGDNVQGEIIGALTDGAAIPELMNAVPYDLSIPGNHEFDYGMDGFFKLLKTMKYAELSLNFEDLKVGKPVLDAHKTIELGGRRVAFVGLSTPESYTKSTPKYFVDAEGKQAYGFGESSLYEKVQAAVDAARAEGAELVILVSHLGVNGVTPEWSAPAVIAATRGIDAVIDGHSHEVFAGERYKNADGKEVLYTQTGSHFMFFGKMTLSADGSLRSELIHPADVKPGASEASQKAYDEVQAIIDADSQKLAYLNEKLGAAEVPLATHDPATGLRLVRIAECSMGDFTADAYRAVLGSQIAIVNGGGVRSSVGAGDVTRLDLMNVNPWNNEMCVVELSGQKLLDTLEFQSRSLPDQECGGFLQVSGMTCEIDAAVPSPVKVDDKGVFSGIGEGKTRRVKNVRVGGEPLDPAASYSVGGSVYLLLNGGSGTDTADAPKIIKREGLPTDAECLIKYFTETLNGKVTAENYPSPLGEGRIVITR